MRPQQIRVITICLIYKDDSILVFEGYDHTKAQTFYRPLGGGIDFGETSLDALQREFHEEINAQLVNLRYFCTLENIFTCYGETGHEIVIIYTGEFADKSIYDKNVIVGREDNGDAFKALWMPISGFQKGRFPLYPDGLLEILIGK